MQLLFFLCSLQIGSTLTAVLKYCYCDAVLSLELTDYEGFFFGSGRQMCPCWLTECFLFDQVVDKQ